MPTPIKQLLSRTLYSTDGYTIVWDFSFSGGYLDKGHVKAFSTDGLGARTTIVVTPDMLTGPFQLVIVPAIPSGSVLTIYRDTPKDLPIVDFTDESGFSEIALDTNAKQAVFIAAEAMDTVSTAGLDDIPEALSQVLIAVNEATAQADLAAGYAANVGAVVVDVFDGTGALTSFGLSAVPTSKNNTLVLINGIVQHQSTYSTLSNTITFTAPPPSGTANIEVRTGTFVVPATITGPQGIQGAPGVVNYASPDAIGNVAPAAGTFTDLRSTGELRIAKLKLGVSEGVAGQLLASAGPGNTPTWVSVAGLTVTPVAGTTLTAVAGNHYILNSATPVAITMPATLIAGDKIWFTGINAVVHTIARNGNNIMGLAEDFTCDLGKKTYQFDAVTTTDWRFTT